MSDSAKVKVFWLSFADEDGHLGSCAVESTTEIGAVTKAHTLGINPGGEVAIVECPTTREEFLEHDLELDRLYTKEELMARDDMELHIRPSTELN